MAVPQSQEMRASYVGILVHFVGIVHRETRLGSERELSDYVSDLVARCRSHLLLLDSRVSLEIFRLWLLLLGGIASSYPLIMRLVPLMTILELLLQIRLRPARVFLGVELLRTVEGR